MVFISPNSVAWHNVRNEINFALNKRKPFLAIHLIDTELPPGLELRMGDIQAILKWRMGEESYKQKLGKALPPSLQAELKPRAHVILNSYRVLVMVQDATTHRPISGADVDVTLVNTWRDSPKVQLLDSTIQATAKTGHSGSAAFAIVPDFLCAEDMRFVATARATGFVQQHACLDYPLPQAMAGLTRESEDILVLHPSELERIGVDEEVLLKLHPDQPARTKTSYRPAKGPSEDKTSTDHPPSPPAPDDLLVRARTAARILDDDTVAQQAQRQFGAFQHELESHRKGDSAGFEVSAGFRGLRDIVEEAEKRIAALQQETGNWCAQNHLGGTAYCIRCVRCGHEEHYDPKEDGAPPKQCSECGYMGSQT